MKFAIEITCEAIEVSAGEIIPRGYGLAWRNVHRETGVFMPMPFNLVARYARWAFWALKVPNIRLWERAASSEELSP